MWRVIIAVSFPIEAIGKKKSEKKIRLQREAWFFSGFFFPIASTGKLSFDDIIGRYNRIKDEYVKSAIGAKHVIAAVFFEFHPVSQRDD